MFSKPIAAMGLIISTIGFMLGFAQLLHGITDTTVLVRALILGQTLILIAVGLLLMVLYEMSKSR